MSLEADEVDSIAAATPQSKRRNSIINKADNVVADTIHVVCRFRPFKKSEIELHGQSAEQECFNFDESIGTVEAISDFEKKSFTFDKLFGVNATQAEIFDEVKMIVDSVMEGFNGTILAYGQTSSGKTHTMEGPSLWDEEMQGVIPRSVDRLFDHIANADVHTQFTVCISYFEVYCEKIRDLLNPAGDNLKMRESKTEGFMITDIMEVYCTDREGVIRAVETGKANRASAPTLMNAESSRSHSILSILVNQKNEITGRNRRGKVYLVDLAGSEKVSKTGARGTRLEEAKNINKSLTSLGMVINALCDGQPHIPYRDSKLTRILQDSLGGNSKTNLIICCAPEPRHLSETISTLRFGERAKRIKNTAIVNEELGVPELKALLLLAKKEIDALKRQLSLTNTGSTIDDISVNLAVDLEAEDSSDEIDDGPSTPRPTTEAASNSRDLLRIAMLEEELDRERSISARAREECLEMQAQTNALQSTIAELEQKLVESNLQQQNTVTRQRSLSRPEVPVTEEAPSMTAVERADAMFEVLSGSGKITTPESPKRPATVPLQSVEQLKEEGDQLRSLLVGEIETLENTLSAREEETKTARATAAEFAEKYARLREEHENQIQRLILKLSQEQHERTEIEDRLEQALQRLWAQQPESTKKGFFAKLFHIETPVTKSASAKRENELCREIESLRAKVSQLHSSLDSTKEAQRIVLETKESVMRLLLKQNVSMTQERDTLAARVEELTSTVEQLTNLLRSVQSRKASAIEVHSNMIHGGGGLHKQQSVATR